jgi:dolichol kinase
VRIGGHRRLPSTRHLPGSLAFALVSKLSQVLLAFYLRMGNALVLALHLAALPAASQQTTVVSRFVDRSALVT